MASVSGCSLCPGHLWLLLGSPRKVMAGQTRGTEAQGCCRAGVPPTVHCASTAAICWMSSTVLTLRETSVSVTFLRIWARSCHLESGSAAMARACSYCGWRAQGRHQEVTGRPTSSAGGHSAASHGQQHEACSLKGEGRLSQDPFRGWGTRRGDVGRAHGGVC